ACRLPHSPLPAFPHTVLQKHGFAKTTPLSVVVSLRVLRPLCVEGLSCQRFHTSSNPLPSDRLLWCEFARPDRGTMRPLRRPNLFDWLSVCANCPIIPCLWSCWATLPLDEACALGPFLAF